MVRPPKGKGKVSSEQTEISSDVKENVISINTNLKTVSFLLHKDHGFIQAPYEEITEEKYNKLNKGVKEITLFNKNTFELNVGSDCDSGACPIR